MDGCFLKGYYDGQILAVIGRDPNDKMLPIAFVIVEGETKGSWSWFLELLTANLEGVRLCNTYTFISEQQKFNISFVLMILKCFLIISHMIKSSSILTILHDLLSVLEELLPNVDQRFSVRYHYLNLFTVYSTYYLISFIIVLLL